MLVSQCTAIAVQRSTRHKNSIKCRRRYLMCVHRCARYERENELPLSHLCIAIARCGWRHDAFSRHHSHRAANHRPRAENQRRWFITNRANETPKFCNEREIAISVVSISQRFSSSLLAFSLSLSLFLRAFVIHSGHSANERRLIDAIKQKIVN